MAPDPERLRRKTAGNGEKLYAPEEIRTPDLRFRGLIADGATV